MPQSSAVTARRAATTLDPDGMAAEWWRSASSTRSTCAASATRTATAPATCAACAAASATCKELGVDAIWFNPWYPLAARRRRLRRRGLPRHPPRVRHARGGRALIAEALELGIRTIIDVVPNHVSSEHPWFQAGARRRARVARARAVLVPPGQGPGRRRDAHALDLELPGRHVDAHRRTPTARRGSGTCTCSRPSSPTSTGTTPTCVREHEDILRFWFDRGVAGVRIDSAGAAHQGPGAARGARRVRARRAPAPRTATRCTTSTARWRAHRRLLRRARACSSARCGCPTPERFAALPPARRDAHGVQLRLHGAARGMPRSSAPRST